LICVNCGSDREVSCFYLRLKGQPERRRLCKDCDKIARKGHPKQSGPSGRSTKRGGISGKEYQRLLDEQHGVCKICGGNGKRRLAVDHDHVTKQVRALLCGRCNIGLGYFLDNSELLEKAADYLRSYK
jgi:hypothetical protein